MLAGTIGVIACAPVSLLYFSVVEVKLGMLYGASRAETIIRTHPNHEHLLKVLKETRAEIMSGRFENPSQSDSSDDSGQWPSETSVTDPSAPPQSSSTTSSFDDDKLLTDDEIDRQSRGGLHRP
jgi:hypothetical protein